MVGGNYPRMYEKHTPRLTAQSGTYGNRTSKYLTA